MSKENTIVFPSFTMTPQSIAAYIQYEVDQGASDCYLPDYKRATKSLYAWLPDDKTITKGMLFAWRQSLRDHGYAETSIRRYVKNINRYLEYIGGSSIRFNRSEQDITGKEVGYLTAIEPIGKRCTGGGIVWRCRCKCGKEVERPANKLLTSQTISCGCLRGEHLKAFGKFMDGTSLRQSIEEQVYSTRSQSGYTGVSRQGDKWRAQITYKGQTFSLGRYAKLDDAVKARARGKELVQMDAMGLLNIYEELHKDDPVRPNLEQVKSIQKASKPEPPSKSEITATRIDNTSGCPGVFRKQDKWAAKITYQKTTYRLGSYESLDEAIAVRKEAERMLQENAAGFPDWVLNLRQSRKKKGANSVAV